MKQFKTNNITPDFDLTRNSLEKESRDSILFANPSDANHHPSLGAPRWERIQSEHSAVLGDVWVGENRPRLGVKESGSREGRNRVFFSCVGGLAKGGLRVGVGFARKNRLRVRASRKWPRAPVGTR